MLCKCRLTEDAKGGDRDVVFGEEAHIVSEKPEKGPRYHPMLKEEVDTYANLMLLCPSDHKIVDEQVLYYTKERLHALKREHEQWVEYRFSPTPPPIRVRDPEAGKPLALRRIDTGKELMRIASHKYAIHHDSPDPRSEEEAELIGAFVQSITDYNDIWDDIGSNGQVQAEFSITNDIARLREADLVVYAGARNHVLEGGASRSSPWLVANLVIRRSDDEVVEDSTTDK
jgi:hypothetical protein